MCPTGRPYTRGADRTFGRGPAAIVTRPRTSTLLTYSETCNPGSPYHTDRTALFSRSAWVTERFTEAEIHADPELATTTVTVPDRLVWNGIVVSW